MAQAFAIIHGSEKAEAYSAGSSPSGYINPKAVEAMKELGYDLTTHTAESLDDLSQIQFDYVVTMGCGDECPFIPAKNRLNWSIPDPKEMDEKDFRQVRDLIDHKVKEFFENIE